MHSRFFGYMYSGHYEYSQYFEVLYCGYFRTRSFSGLVALVILLVLQVFRGSVPRVPQVPAVLRPLVLRVLRLLAVVLYQNALNICPVCFDYLRIVSIISCPLFCRKHSQIVPRVGHGENFFRWGQLEYLQSTGSASGIYTASTRSISRLCTVYTECAPRYSGVWYRWYGLYSGFCTAHTPSTRSNLVAISPILSVLRAYSEYEVYQEHL